MKRLPLFENFNRKKQTVVNESEYLSNTDYFASNTQKHIDYLNGPIFSKKLDTILRTIDNPGADKTLPVLVFMEEGSLYVHKLIPLPNGYPSDYDMLSNKEFGVPSEYEMEIYSTDDHEYLINVFSLDVDTDKLLVITV